MRSPAPREAQAHFVHLNKNMQDEMIVRTEHKVRGRGETPAASA